MTRAEYNGRGTDTKRAEGSRFNISHGLTLLEVLIALFIFAIGICGVLAALPVGITSAEWVILQDASIHLAHSKFAEFRRDRIDPTTELSDMAPWPAYMDNRHGAVNTSKHPTLGKVWRNFLHGTDDTYHYFEDIDRYEWRLELGLVSSANAGSPKPDPPPAVAGGSQYLFPSHSSAGALAGLRRVSIIVHLKGTTREFRFTQYLFDYGRSAIGTVDPDPTVP